MKKMIVYIVATLACVVILYFIIAIFFKWNHGGGTLPMMILMGIIVAVWKGVVNLVQGKERENIKLKNDNFKKSNLESADNCCQAKENTSFIFSLDLSSFADLSLVDVKAMEIIKDAHCVVKKTLMEHVEFLQKNHRDKVVSDKDFVACSCLEVGALYWYFVISDFSKKQIEKSIGQCFFVPFFFNFEKFEDRLNDMGYGGLLDFFGHRATSIQINLGELKGLSFERYWDYIMVFHPLIKMDEKFTGVTEVVCGIDTMVASSVYYRSLIAAISDQSLKLTDRLIKRR